MQINRFYCQDITQGQAVLGGSEAHHLINVMRLNTGDKIELFDGNGTLADAIINKIKSAKVTVTVENIQKHKKPPLPQIVIASSIAKGDRFEWLIAKCTELGADRIIPVIFERTVKQPKNPKITQRWNNIAVSSAKQCKRLFLPKIDTPVRLGGVLEKIKTDYPNANIITGSLSDSARSIMDIKIDNDILAFVGPEGGITDEEENLLCRFGAKSVRLTDTVLRIETASVTFAAILSAKRMTS